MLVCFVVFKTIVGIKTAWVGSIPTYSRQTEDDCKEAGCSGLIGQEIKKAIAKHHSFTQAGAVF